MEERARIDRCGLRFGLYHSKKKFPLSVLDWAALHSSKGGCTFIHCQGMAYDNGARRLDWCVLGGGSLNLPRLSDFASLLVFFCVIFWLLTPHEAN